MSEKITMTDGKLTVPDNPQIPFISGDGIGPEIWAAKEVFDVAVKKAYAGQKAVDWIPLLAGQTAFDQTGQWLPDETLETLRENLVAIKGPLTTPVGKGHRSINVTLRQSSTFMHVSDRSNTMKERRLRSRNLKKSTLQFFGRTRKISMRGLILRRAAPELKN